MPSSPIPACRSGLPAQARDLPEPTPEAREHSAWLEGLVRDAIAAAGGALPFDRFMELALYAPGLGYYVAGARKLGAAGDFVTAPEVSPLFGRCLARQCAELLGALGGGDLLELGAGSGALAANLLAELDRLGRSPRRYLILDVSPELRARQAETLAARVPDRVGCVEWLDALPSPGSFCGVVLGNEVLDALPVHRFRIAGDAVLEGAVGVSPDGLVERWVLPVSPGLAEAVVRIQDRIGPLPDGYTSEVSLRIPPWLAAVASVLDAAALLLIDYGYTRREYYHPDRSGGTLLCHYRHRVHADPLHLLGLQDITASVDFTAVAEAGTAAGLSLAGYTTQAHFLLANGLDRLLAESDPGDTARHLALVQGAKLLTLPGEMGERFKAIGLDKGLGRPWSGFALRDLGGRL